MWKSRDDGNTASQPQVDDKLLGDDEANTTRRGPQAVGLSHPDFPTDSKEPGVVTHSQTKKHGAQPSQNFFRRAGKRSLLLGLLCIVAVAVALAFLSWLWYGRRDEVRWRQLMLGGWSNQAITIAGVVLRTALSVLAAIATSMIVSVALEQRRGVPLQYSLRLSVALFTSPSPTTFWHELLFRRHFIGPSLRALLLLLLASTLVTQFSSTILLSDLGMGPVTDFPAQSTNRTAFAWANAVYGPVVEGQPYPWAADFQGHNVPFQSRQEYWSDQPQASHTFAEYSEPGITDMENVDDTGPTLRAFLPIADQNRRTSLKQFSGLAPVFDTRVVCVRPELVNATMNREIYNMTLRLPPSLGDSIPGLTTTEEDFTVILPRIVARGGHAWGVHPLDPSVGGLLSPLDASSQQGLGLTYTKYEPDRAPTRFQGKVKPPGVWRSTGEHACGVDLGNAYAVMDTRGPYGTRGEHAPHSIADNAIKAIPGEGPSLRLEFERFPNDGMYEGFFWKIGDLTVCFDSLPRGGQYHHLQDFNIMASGAGEQHEPMLNFHEDTVIEDIMQLRAQLRAVKEDLDLHTRGLLQLESVEGIREAVNASSDQWRAYCAAAPEMELLDPAHTWDPNIYGTPTYSWVKEMALGLLQRPIALCAGNSVVLGDEDVAIRASRGLAWLFALIIEDLELGSPAVAMQAMLTHVLREAYYSWLPALDHSSGLETVQTGAVQIPLRFLGLWIVFGITLLHLILCLTAFGMFAMMTRTSCLDNGWQAVAEVMHHEDSRRVIDEAAGKKDDEVEEWISGQQSLRQRFNVGHWGGI